MNLNQDNINEFLNKYIKYVDNLSNDLKYGKNIRHLLYVVVPAFVLKYGINNESTILKCFDNVKIYIRDHNENVQAAFNRSLRKKDNSYYTDKFITVNPFSTSSLSTILDNIIHEFNHAINSINNEIIITDDLIKLRTGLTTLNYNKEDIEYINKSDEIILEELLNTSQSEEVMNIIKSFGKYNIENQELANTLYSINKELGEEDYESSAYLYQKKVCGILIDNKTFAPTINNLRFKGLIDEIPDLFDNVIGKEGSYKKLNELLSDMHAFIIKYSESRFFKKRYLNKIKELSNEVIKLIEDYDKKCIFK